MPSSTSVDVTLLAAASAARRNFSMAARLVGPSPVACFLPDSLWILSCRCMMRGTISVVRSLLSTNETSTERSLHPDHGDIVKIISVLIK